MPSALQFRATNTHPYAPGRAFHNPRTSLGSTGHWVKTAGLLLPLAIGEFVPDPDQRWRLIRIGSVVTALVSELLWTHRIRKERDEARERDRECRAQL